MDMVVCTELVIVFDPATPTSTSNYYKIIARIRISKPILFYSLICNSCFQMVASTSEVCGKQREYPEVAYSMY